MRKRYVARVKFGLHVRRCRALSCFGATVPVTTGSLDHCPLRGNIGRDLPVTVWQDTSIIRNQSRKRQTREMPVNHDAIDDTDTILGRNPGLLHPLTNQSSYNDGMQHKIVLDRHYQAGFCGYERLRRICAAFSSPDPSTADICFRRGSAGWRPNRLSSRLICPVLSTTSPFIR